MTYAEFMEALQERYAKIDDETWRLKARLDILAKDRERLEIAEEIFKEYGPDEGQR